MSISQLLENIKIGYGYDNIIFTQRLLQDVKQKQPYRGLRILHNVPLYKNTLLKIEPLVVGGGIVTVTSPNFSSYDQEAVDLLESCQVSVELDHSKIKDDYDFVLDAGGEFKELITPRIGAAELTKSGEKIYSDPKITYPVINVDNSQLKQLETKLGTGDGLVRGLTFYLNDDFHGKAFVLFGYGKVGSGAALALKQYTSDITIVECDQDRILEAKEDGFDVLVNNDKQAIEKVLSNCYGVITATGKKGLITDYYSPELFKHKVLSNLGIDDEYGSAFTNDEVLNNKQAINFRLDDPTEIKYMDPIFYAHNIVIDLILSGDFTPGLHPFPEDLDKSILQEWMGYFAKESGITLTRAD